jgi:Arc/MetJ family transcription regulator
MCYTLSMRKRTTIWLDEADKAAIAAIQARYGAASESDAIRLAVRLLAESKRVNIQENIQERKRERQP